MKNTLKNLLGVFLITTSLISCTKDDSNNNGGDLKPLNATPENLKGAWEVESWMINGQPATSANNSPAEKLQYEISDTEVRVILSENNQVTWVASAPYKLQNGRIVTEDKANSSLQDLDIITITATTMRVRPLPQESSTTGDLTWNLRRIDPSAIVGGSGGGAQDDGTQGRPGKWREQSIQMEMNTPTQKFIYEKIFKVKGPRQEHDDESLSCRYRSDTKTFELEMMVFNGDSPHPDERDIEAQLWMSGRDVVFDFSKRREEVHFDIVSSRREQRPGFVATFRPPRAKTIYFGLTRDSRCTISLTRRAGNIRFEGACRNIDAYGDRIEGQSGMIVRGACSLP